MPTVCGRGIRKRLLLNVNNKNYIQYSKRVGKHSTVKKQSKIKWKSILIRNLLAQQADIDRYINCVLFATNLNDSFFYDIFQRKKQIYYV